MLKTDIDMRRIVNIENIDFSSEEGKKEILNILEILCERITELEKTNQEQRDEINRLKGEKGKPEIKPNKKEEDNEPNNEKEKMEKPEKKEWKKGSKIDKIEIDRVETIKLDITNLPKDIEFKGHEERIIQNITIQTENVLYKLEKYYSPSEKKTYTAQLDKSLQGTEFGAETKALISTLYYENRVPENKIASFLNTNGLKISEGTVHNILTIENKDELTIEKESIFKAGLQSGIYQQIDDTGIRIKGQNAYVTILCNENYSAFFINEKKNRETIKSIIGEDEKSQFIVLVCDDAPQFKKVAMILALCWIHEERLYKKLMPVLVCHKEALEKVRGEIWDYYDKLKLYKLNPTAEQKINLSAEFDILFGQETGYEALDKRLSLTLAKKESLLVVLEYPKIPLHNNLSENGIREIVIKRKISGGVKSEEGKIAWENNMTILSTCKKLGLSFFEYMTDIFRGIPKLSLAELILS